ncbi:universal stress protein [Microbacterium sp. zg.Y1090]|uniref:universal stress protein n=1 Tax=Microbacterium TaxID=33882 RepID=UPI00214B4D6F|nr:MULTISPECIES: universal stress protein [unclassified Microbacterium]MCR2814223.1 universal stress protein [Microbacterium sp. zg.Y1084]MCR2820005.1 universal stress protein [Microbacterium sp. zg.Y1090]MDL5488205.1 universal stress protein [Microbacterium sp. zg-Y1211]WIM27980.1 universal stress protein [Microbacterium sp. zg-Y1090]
MTGTIVVGVTEAPAARRAVEWATRRAIQRRQKVELVSVVGGAIGTVGEGAVMDLVLDAAQRMLQAEAARVAEAGVEVTTRVDAGNPVTTLAEASERAALLVIGSDYRGPGSGPARGAHGIRIVAASHCPVVVVPDIEIHDRAGVIVGVDGSPVSEHAIAFAAAEADRLGEPLTAVCVWTPVAMPRNATMVYPDLYLKNMQQAATEALALSMAGLRSQYPDLVIEERAVEGHPSAVINDLAAGAKLAVIGTHGRNALARFLLGSVSHEVLQRLATVTVVTR